MTRLNDNWAQMLECHLAQYSDRHSQRKNVVLQEESTNE